jgi:predicted MPP superfamily phosphohydrolase
MSRREFFRKARGGLTGLAAGTFLYTWRVEPHWVEIVERPLPIVGLPQQLAGKRLVQLSDLHAGPVVDQSFLKNSLERVAGLEPDIIALTGDFMTCVDVEEVPRAIDALQSLPSAPLGRLAVLGNHDYGHHHRQDRAADRLSAELERVGVQVLRNQVARIDELQIVGLDEYWTRRHDPDKAFGELDSSGPRLILCHNPDAVDRPVFESYRGWILAGHTHGGQCKPPFFRPPLNSAGNKRYVAGEYDVGPGRRMYINRGLGYLHRVRFNARPEITVFTLQRA